jgi:hypothetical protein
VRALPNAAVRRFAVVWTVSLAVKLAALVLLFVLLLPFLRGS